MGLVLTRKRGEALKIGDDVYVTVDRVEDGSVRLRVDAPRDVRILRLELLGEEPPPPRGRQGHDRVDRPGRDRR